MQTEYIVACNPLAAMHARQPCEEHAATSLHSWHCAASVMLAATEDVAAETLDA